jgi:hypothetical protein
MEIVEMTKIKKIMEIMKKKETNKETNKQRKNKRKEERNKEIFASNKKNLTKNIFFPFLH